MRDAILAQLAEGPALGADLQATLSPGDAAAFRAAARELWIDGLLMGELAVGCCAAPCGPMCVSAMKPERVWQLSKKGRVRLKVAQARAGMAP